MELIPASQAKAAKPSAWVFADRISANEGLKVVHAEEKAKIKADVQKAIKAKETTGEEIRKALKIAGWSKQECSDLLLQYGITGRSKDKPTGKRAIQSAKIEEHAKAIQDFAAGLVKSKADRKAALARAYKNERNA